MSVQKFVQIGINVFGDGTSTTLVVDLEKDPYVVQENFTSGVGAIENWLSEARTNKPVSAQQNGFFPTFGAPAFTASLAYPILTLTFATAPVAGAAGQALVNLVF